MNTFRPTHTILSALFQVSEAAHSSIMLRLSFVHLSRPVIWWRRRKERNTSLPTYKGRIAMVAHVFYPDLLPEILDCHAHMPQGTHLIITAPHSLKQAITKPLNPTTTSSVYFFENRGRDIAPFIELLICNVLNDFDLVVKLHTKKSLHLTYGHLLRKILYLRLAGSRSIVRKIIQLFDDPKVGLIGWRTTWKCSPRYWATNRPHIRALCHALNLAMPIVPAFFGGSMFWLRPVALTRLRTLSLNSASFEHEEGQLDGTLHHAFERLFPLIAQDAGFDTRDTDGRLLVLGKHYCPSK